jgi:hypothetical protein
VSPEGVKNSSGEQSMKHANREDGMKPESPRQGAMGLQVWLFFRRYEPDQVRGFGRPSQRICSAPRAGRSLSDSAE